ncbi:MAG TPA: EAL domain-containing protein [Noviherbaspirillum sp.]|nr:EAL domain-containing protein [Noviherbaspirillum sp.]
MEFSRSNLSSFSRYLWLTVAAVIGLGIVFAFYVRSEKAIDRANESRIESLLLARELRRSSEDLTRMARTYVITGEQIYKQQYQEILDIRDGKKPRPLGYSDLYWTLVIPGTQPQQNSGQTIALLDLVRKVGVTDKEFAELQEAKAKSDALTNTEHAAMRLVESTNPPSDTNRLKASEMLFDAAYHQAKAEIMKPIGEFYQMMDQRTLETVRYHEDMATLMRMVFVAFGLLLIGALRNTYMALHATLGGSVDELHGRIVRIGKGEFVSEDIPAIEAPDNSVLGWLSETQKNLARIDAERKEFEARNQRLTRLYEALSECNQAIVRATDEAELFPQICRGVVVFGGMDMAWIGVPELSSKQVRSVAAYGNGQEYQAGIMISIDENEAWGNGPSGTCAREDRPVWCQDFQNDPATTPWHEHAAQFGWRSSAALPLHRNGVVVGVISLYALEAKVFDEATRSLLIKLAMDIDHALNNFERERQRQLTLAALAESRGLLKTIIDTAPVRIYWKDKDLRYLGCNPAFAMDAKVEKPEDIVGKDDYQLGLAEQAEQTRADDRQILDSGVSRLFCDEQKLTAEGKAGWVRTSKVPLRDDKNRIIGLLGIYEDITEKKRADERIQYLANYDALTGLPSRARLDDHLEYALSIAKRRNGQLALMFLDLDHFKDINDAIGHSVGDAVLVELAGRLRAGVREEDTVARLGGDEFILLLPGTDASGAARVAQKLLDAIAEPFRIGQYVLNLTASIGIAIRPNDGVDLETLSKSADTAMYRAKREGRRTYRFSTPAMQARSARNLQLINAMHEALQQDQFEVYFQPHFSVNDGHIIGAEALLRWRHPHFGEVSPTEFIPVAEDSGLILPIGEKVLRSAVRRAKSWNREGLSPLTIAVNLSVVQFRTPDLPSLVTRILEEEGFPPNRLELELTESAAMTTPQRAIDVMRDLHDRGILMSIDDFGTGYSSLSYIKKFKVHKLKIDQSFIRDIDTDPDDKAIVGAIIQMAKRLGLKTIAEGVESAAQLAYLREQGCDEVQGYYYSKPLSADQFSAFLTELQQSGKTIGY